MGRRARWLLIALLVPTAVVVAALVVVHLPVVQRAAFEKATVAIETATGLRVDADRVSVRLMPAAARLESIRVVSSTGVVAEVESVAAEWSWLELLGDTPRVRLLRVSAPMVDLRHLPPSPTREDGQDEAPPTPAEILASFEIGRFELTRGSAGADVAAIEVAAAGIVVEAGLDDAVATVVAAVEQVTARRQGRVLSLRNVAVELDGGADEMALRRIEIGGDAVSAAVNGTASLTSPIGVHVDLRVEAELRPVLEWWDPDLVDVVDPSGRLVAEGTAGWDASAGPRIDLAHVGRPFSVAGYRVDELTADYGNGVVAATGAGPGWGGFTARLDQDRRLVVTVDLEGLNVDRALVRAGITAPDVAPRGMVASGEIDVDTLLPPSLDAVRADASIDLLWAGGRASVEGRASDGEAVLRTVEIALGDARLAGSGRIDRDRGITAELDLDVPDPSDLVARLRGWGGPVGPAVSGLGLDLAGGPIRAEARIGGTVAEPEGRLTASWTAPWIEGIRLERIDATVDADGRSPIRWYVAVAPTAGSRADATGSTELANLDTVAAWTLDIPDLAAATAVLPVELPDLVDGALDGEGTVTWSPSASWTARGGILARNIRYQDWVVESATVEATADPSTVAVSFARATLLGGTVEAAGEIGLHGVDSPLAFAVDVDGIEVAELPLALPAEVIGVVSARLEATGSVARPRGTVEVSWGGDDPTGVVRRADATASLTDGVVTLSVPALETAAGTVAVRATAPLGAVPRPDWLWPDAPRGAIRATAAAADLRSGPLAAALGRPALPVELVTDLNAEIQWDLDDVGQRFAEVRLEGLELANSVETVRSDGPIVLRVDGQRAVVESATLAGARTRIEIGGTYSFADGELRGAADAVVAPEMARLLPVAVQVRAPLRVTAQIEGALDNLDGRIEVTHPDGRIVMRDPALAIQDIRLVATLDDGSLWIEDGRATVNRGTVELAGGWDPASGQGIVIDMQHVVFLLPYDILTRWSGNLALEPDPSRMVNVVGDLVLEGGVWDRSVDLAGIVLGPTALAPPADDPMWEIGLDLDVRGRGGLAVDNNLGEFEVNWNLLEIRGTAAQPAIVGDIRVAPGGTLNLAGRQVTVRRGTIGFTGNPATDPTVEIVPVDDVAVFGGGGDGSGIDATAAARRGVAQGIGAVLGLENETLRPAEIAIETDTDTTTTFTAGQRLTRNVALFLTTDLADVQERTTMLQLWNFRGLPGLALQAWERSGDEDAGTNVVQRFRWGGTISTDDRPVIHKIRLEGEWPGWKWLLKRKLGIHKGEPYEPFVAFAAGLRLERELASRGWQLARVDLETSGAERSPTLEYTVEPGPRTRVVFLAHEPAKHIRSEVTALYQPPPLEKASFEAMTDLLERHYRSEGHPYADIDIDRADGAVRIRVDRGRELHYEGPVVEGVTAESAEAIRAVIGNPSELVALLEDPDRGEKIVRRILHNEGYRQARLLRVWADPVGDHLSRVYLEVDPGPRATIHDLLVSGDDPLGIADDQPALRPGGPLDRMEIERAADRIEREYRDSGWVDAAVRVRFEGKDGGPWDVVLDLQAGASQTVASVNFNGRRHVSTKALTSGLELNVGDALKMNLLDQSVIEIATFAPIERLGVEIRPLGGGQSALDFAVEERPRWLVEVGAGWSSDRGSEARFGIRDGGLLGRGGSVSLRGRWQKDEQLALLYLSLPPLPGRRISFGSAVRWERGDSDDNPALLEDEVVSVTLETTFNLSGGRGVRPYYRLSETTTSLQEPDPILDLFFPQTDVESILGLQLYRDTLDNPFDPRSGSYLALDTNWNSPELGSDINDIRSLVTASLAWTSNGGLTWAQAARIGIAEALGGTNLINQRKFKAGGQASLRGFEKDLVGPVTIDSDGNIRPDGGGALFVLNEELRIPVWRGVRVAVFTDVGQVWESWSDADADFSIGAGVGIRYTTPIGPLWADVAWPVYNRGVNSAGARFYFGIGRPF